MHLTKGVRNGRPYLTLRNPTPYHYTFNRLDLANGKQQKNLPGIDMVAPMSQLEVALPNGFEGAGLQAIVTVINDHGGISKPLTLPVHDTP
ncbi:hypothetical protein D3C80_1780890 [compost metagenome]